MTAMHSNIASMAFELGICGSFFFLLFLCLFSWNKEFHGHWIHCIDSFHVILSLFYFHFSSSSSSPSSTSSSPLHLPALLIFQENIHLDSTQIHQLDFPLSGGEHGIPALIPPDTTSVKKISE